MDKESQWDHLPPTAGFKASLTLIVSFFCTFQILHLLTWVFCLLVASTLFPGLLEPCVPWLSSRGTAHIPIYHQTWAQDVQIHCQSARLTPCTLCARNCFPLMATAPCCHGGNSSSCLLVPWCEDIVPGSQSRLTSAGCLLSRLLALPQLGTKTSKPTELKRVRKGGTNHPRGHWGDGSQSPGL